MPDDQSAGLLGLAPSMPDLAGTPYLDVLARLHEVLTPQSYLEIGVETGATLALSRCPSIGIDPAFRFAEIETVQRITAKRALMLFQMPSDDFFATYSPTALLGRPLDMAFLDGMHRCEFLLRDFINTERHCRPNAVVALHDCVPLELGMADRIRGMAAVDPRRRFMWTGDVWRTLLLLKRVRPDLSITVLDASPTGLVLITNLDPANTTLAAGYDGFVRQMLGWSLGELTLPGFYDEVGLQPAAHVAVEEDITARFWL